MVWESFVPCDTLGLADRCPPEIFTTESDPQKICWFGGSSFRFVLAPGFGVEQQRSTVADAEEQGLFVDKAWGYEVEILL